MSILNDTLEAGPTKSAMIHMVGMIFQKGAENPRLSRLIILRKNTTTALTVSIIILAGGLGTRISEESHLKPKPMITIGDQPILWHIMNR